MHPSKTKIRIGSLHVRYDIPLYLTDPKRRHTLHSGCAAKPTAARRLADDGPLRRPHHLPSPQKASTTCPPHAMAKVSCRRSDSSGLYAEMHKRACDRTSFGNRSPHSTTDRATHARIRPPAMTTGRGWIIVPCLECRHRAAPSRRKALGGSARFGSSSAARRKSAIALSRSPSFS
jgi:hypothetical protein